jgi:serine/threonine-protein kinase RsbW
MKVPKDFGIADAALHSVSVLNNLQDIRQPESEIMAALQSNGYQRDTTFAIKLAFEEAITNAVKHGNCGDPAKQVHLRWYVDPERVVLMVRDEGCGFKPEDVPDPTSDENLERPSGRGIMLMSAYMTKVRYSASGNEVWMLKENPNAAAAHAS